MDFLIEHGVSWKSWAKRVPQGEQDEITARLTELQNTFGRPHLHSGLGLRRLRGDAFEFRASRARRIIFIFLKPNRLRLLMVGNHDDVRTWIRENL
jgi:hypothetical protein